MQKQLKYIDLFSGCGGLSLGLFNAGWKGIFAVEKSPDAFKTLKHNLIDKNSHFDWPKWLGEPRHLDINYVIEQHEQDLIKLRGNVDMVTGGPPCQGFSTAGKRNEEDLRNRLIDSYIKFVRLVQPKILFFENVKGFTMEFNKNKSKGEKYSDHVIKELTEDYDVKGHLINFADFGVPQKRTRFILVGIRKDIATKRKVIAEDFFQKIEANKTQYLVSKGLKVKTTLEEAISDLLMKNGTIQSPDTKSFRAGIYSDAISTYQKEMRKDVDKGKDPDSHRFVNHSAPITQRFTLILKSEARNKTISDALKEQLHLKKRTMIPLDGKQTTPTITTLPDDYIHYLEPRILTVREYARIQTFPDSYEFQGKYTTGGERRTQEVPRYTQIGNSIPPLFGEQSGIVLKQLVIK